MFKSLESRERFPQPADHVDNHTTKVMAAWFSHWSTSCTENKKSPVLDLWRVQLHQFFETMRKFAFVSRLAVAYRNSEEEHFSSQFLRHLVEKTCLRAFTGMIAHLHPTWIGNIENWV